MARDKMLPRIRNQRMSSKHKISVCCPNFSLNSIQYSLLQGYNLFLTQCVKETQHNGLYNIECFCFLMLNNLRKKNFGEKSFAKLVRKTNMAHRQNNSIIRLPATQYRNQETLCFPGRV